MRAEVNKVRLTVLIALLFSTLCAGVFRTPPILFMSALLLSAPFVGFLLSRWSSRSLQLTRTLPSSGMVGDVLMGEIRLLNASRIPAFLVHACAGESSVQADSGANGEAGGASIEAVGSEHVAPFLRGHAGAGWQQQWYLRRRGVHRLESARAGALDPLGLGNYLPARSQPDEIVVLPRTLKIERLGFFGGEGFEQHAPLHSIAVADAMDFHGVRLWQPGEAIRRAHWKYTARTGQLHIIEWEETPTIDLAIFLDTHAAAMAGDRDDNTLEAAIVATASIASYLLENGCRVELFFFAPEKSEGKPESISRPNVVVESGTQKVNKQKQVNDSRPFELRQHAARSVAGREAIMRALAGIEPITAPDADLKNLVEAASPLVSRSLSTLAIASSRAPMDAVIARTGGARGTRLHAFILDAESFEMSTPPARSAQPVGVTATITAARRGTYRWKRGQSLAAALEGLA